MRWKCERKVNGVAAVVEDAFGKILGRVGAVAIVVHEEDPRRFCLDNVENAVQILRIEMGESSFVGQTVVVPTDPR